MYNEIDLKEIKKNNMLLNLIWFGTFITYAFYFNIVNRQPYLDAQFNLDMIKGNSSIFIFIIIGLISSIIGIIISRKLYSDIHFTENKIFKLLSSSSREANYIVHKESKIKVDLNRVFSTTVISIGLVHTLVLYGLVGAMNIQNIYVFYIFASISIVCMLLIKPKLKKLLEI